MEGAQRVVLLQLWSLSLAGPGRAADPQRTLLRSCDRRGHAALAALGARPGTPRERRWLGAVRRDEVGSQRCRRALCCIGAHLCEQLRGLIELGRRGGH